VVGYGTMRKRDLTGAVSQLKGDEIADLPLRSASDALQGKAAGVTITSTSGTPGAMGTVRIREVGLIVAKKGLDTGLMAPQFFAPIIILIIVSSLATPILLKVVYKKWPGKENEEADNRSEKLAENEKYLTQEVVGATYNITEDNFKDKSKDE